MRRLRTKAGGWCANDIRRSSRGLTDEAARAGQYAVAELSLPVDASITLQVLRLLRARSVCADPSSRASRENRPRSQRWSILVDRVSKVCGKSSLRGGSRSQRGAALLRRDLSWDSPKACVLGLPSEPRSRIAEGAGAALRVSSDDNKLLLGFRRKSPQRLLSPML